MGYGKYARVFKNQKQAIAYSRRAIKKHKVVYGRRGGRINSVSAKPVAIRVYGGYIAGARRR